MDLKGIGSDERGVSPVIGVILMLGLVVAAAALVSVFVFDSTGQQTGQSAQVSLDFSENSSGAQYTVIKPGNVDTLYFKQGGSQLDSIGDPSAGDRTSQFTNLSDGDRVVVIANVNGENQTVRTDTYSP